MLTTLLRLGEGRTLKRLKASVGRVGSLSADIERLTDDELRGKTGELRARAAVNKSLDHLLPEAFAVAREAAWRVLDQRPYDVQVMGGAALHFGNIAEMGTGEGKTLACVMPAYLNALSGKGVHVVTVNDYLAKRDAEQMGRVHRFLGLKVGVILSEMKPEERRAAYNADITYGTNNELGFDYLRDNMAHRLDDLVQRGHNYAIVDEVDSILIDEARTPLIISGPADEASNWYSEFARLAEIMKRDVHYEVDDRKRTVGVHEAGIQLVEDQLGIDSFYEVPNSPLVSYLNNAVKAKELYHGDKDYIVSDGEVLIVDEFTGRVLVGRRYNEGLHQAIEAKEGVEVKPENQTLATITLQNYFRLYGKLAGMTGTAQTEAAEFRDIYRLGVVTIPPNKPTIRDDEPDIVYKTEKAKFDAVVTEVTKRYAKEQPVLIGTTSVGKSEYLSGEFVKRGIPHAVLNARHPEAEAAIVAEAGRRQAITVATDMAGRGTDIVLGGNVDFLTDKRLQARGLDPVKTADEYEAAWRDERAAVKAEATLEAKEVAALGGLYVLGTERHESRRIDNQLRGRSGRQGDPGETRFYLSLGDELMRRYNGEGVQKMLTRLKLPDDMPIESKIVSREIATAQTQVEQVHFEMRKNVLKYDEVMDQQRKVIYSARQRILHGDDVSQQLHGMLVDVLKGYVRSATSDRRVSQWDIDALSSALEALYPLGLKSHRWRARRQKSASATRRMLLNAVIKDADEAFTRREAQIDELIGEDARRQRERDLLLDVLDRKWREHLYAMDYLKEGIGLRALAQRDPLVEFQQEGFDMFTAMLDAVREDSLSALFNIEVNPEAHSTKPVAPALGGQVVAEFCLGSPEPAPAPAAAAREHHLAPTRPSNAPSPTI